eukprot:TRINITY_DN3971_c0_g1_i2.p1 TRINITY_DN3971_c0_g1~~TRINITY_DN3971_c0_g1_i2.p1  ORF type:complete len:150 (+),score=44.98 TRINITY_DN3971_c0_g1_i2:120-569(+)
MAPASKSKGASPQPQLVQKLKERRPLQEKRKMSSSRGGGVAKQQEDSEVVAAFSGDVLQSNMKLIYYCRTFLSILAGVVAGILGLKGSLGFVCYVAAMAAGSLALWLKVKGEVGNYFDTWQRVAFDGIGQGAMSFVLFWALAYDIVHIF